MSLTTGFPLSERQRTMVAELKAYLDDTFDPKHEVPIAGAPEWADDDEFEWACEYNRQLARDGWLIPHWPVEYGGRGWDAVDQMLIREEFAYRRVPVANINGLDMLAPILMQFGTEEQRRLYLPGIANCDTIWAQGYSEPDSGSDLGSLRTRAERRGDHYVVNGSKTWTGAAMRAHWMFVLCRTDPQSTGTRGLSLLLVDLESPGVEVRPIKSMTGAVTFGLEFLNDVQVPAANLLGEENGAWQSTRALLEVERTGVGKAAGRRRQLDDLLGLLSGLDGGRTVGQADRIRLGQFIEQVESGRAMAYAAAAAAVSSGMPPHMPSVLKVYLSDLGARLSEFAVQTLGLEALEFAPDQGIWNYWDDYLYTLLSPIAGGANEVQQEIIGQRRFGIRRS